MMGRTWADGTDWRGVVTVTTAHSLIPTASMQALRGETEAGRRKGRPGEGTDATCDLLGTEMGVALGTLV